MPDTSFWDIVCNECGNHAKVAEHGNAGLNFPCAGCGTILQAPGNKPADVPPGGKHTVRELPHYIPKHPERATPKSDTEYVGLEIDGHIYSGFTRESAESIKRSIANGTLADSGAQRHRPSPPPPSNDPPADGQCPMPPPNSSGSVST